MIINHSRPPGIWRSTLGAFALMAVIVLPQIAVATTGANHIIRNTVTVSYDDTSGTPQSAITASVDITVNLVTAQALLSAPVDQSTDPATTVIYSYAITSQANGPESYNLAAALSESANISGSTVTIRNDTDTTTISTTTLGGTSVATAGTIAAAGTTAIIVPADSANNGTVNGIHTGSSTVVINGAEYTVASVDDSNGGVANATSIITVNGNGAAATVAVGDLITERHIFLVKIVPGTVTATIDQTITVDVDAQDSGAVFATVTDQTVTTVTVATLSVVKYVANTSNPVVGGGSSVTLDTGNGAGSITYYTSGVTGNPGDTLEYVIEVSNAAGGSTATDVILTDPVPAFTTYTAGTMRLDPGTGVFGGAADGDTDNDAGETDGSTVYLYAGSGGTDNGPGFGNGVGGSLVGGSTTYGVFRVTIDN
ncbi:MAG: hypothetical protein R8K46_08895 [Mariprofundaceae bacterium]